jgi:hypothetical protein
MTDLVARLLKVAKGKDEVWPIEEEAAEAIDNLNEWLDEFEETVEQLQDEKLEWVARCMALMDAIPPHMMVGDVRRMSEEAKAKIDEERAKFKEAVPAEGETMGRLVNWVRANPERVRMMRVALGDAP